MEARWGHGACCCLPFPNPPTPVPTPLQLPLQGGDLRAALSGERAEALSWRRHGRQVALDIAAGLAHLHAHNVMHRDLKSKNVRGRGGWAIGTRYSCTRPWAASS